MFSLDQINFNIKTITIELKMNKLKFLLVFISGACFALLLPFLQKSLDSWSESIKELEIHQGHGHGFYLGLGIFTPETNLDLMDDGYVTMARLRAYDGDTALSMKKTTEIEEKNSLIEAENTLRAGERLMSAGMLVKAGRLLERAVALAPTLPHALLSLGEFVETEMDDVVRADQLYLRALTIAPHNSRAIRNRQRTKHIVVALDLSMLKQVADKRLQLSYVPSTSPALRRIQQEAHLHHIHHTIAIEGNTLTFSQIRTILETGRSIGGKSVLEHTEVLGVVSALRFINGSLLNRVGPITLKDILDIHVRVLGHTDPPAAGHLRTTQVFVGAHVPPGPPRLAGLMDDFVSWINHPASVAMHPIRYAALAHYHLVYIHPFVDGNGRTARLLMNFILMQAGYPPVIIRHQDRLQYYDTLQAGHEGDTRPFIRFIAHSTEKTLDVYLWATQDSTPGIEQARESNAARINVMKADESRKASSATSTINVKMPGESSGQNKASNRINLMKAQSVTVTGGDNEDEHGLQAARTASHRMNYPDEQTIGDEDSKYGDVGKTSKSSSSDILQTSVIPESEDTESMFQHATVYSSRLKHSYFETIVPNTLVNNNEINEEQINDFDHLNDLNDDLGIVFRASEDETIAGPAVHKWLTGESSGEYMRSSRYYSRQYNEDYHEQVHDDYIYSKYFYDETLNIVQRDGVDTQDRVRDAVDRVNQIREDLYNLSIDQNENNKTRAL